MYERTGVDSEPKVTRSATSVVASDMDTDRVRRDPEPAVDGRIVDGVPATIEPYALSNADGDVDHTAGLRGGRGGSSTCDSAEDVGSSFARGMKGSESAEVASVEDGYEGSEVLVSASAPRGEGGGHGEQPGAGEVIENSPNGDMRLPVEPTTFPVWLISACALPVPRPGLHPARRAFPYLNQNRVPLPNVPLRISHRKTPRRSAPSTLPSAIPAICTVVSGRDGSCGGGGPRTGILVPVGETVTVIETVAEPLAEGDVTALVSAVVSE